MTAATLPAGVERKAELVLEPPSPALDRRLELRCDRTAIGTTEITATIRGVGALIVWATAKVDECYLVDVGARGVDLWIGRAAFHLAADELPRVKAFLERCERLAR